MKRLRAEFGGPRASGCPGSYDATFVAHITASRVYFQYSSSRPPQSHKVVSLPGIQLTPNKQSPTGGRGSLNFAVLCRSDARGFHSILVAFLTTFEASRECFGPKERDHCL